jgi:hypothetical protein
MLEQGNGLEAIFGRNCCVQEVNMVFESLGEALGKGILQMSTVRARKWQENGKERYRRLKKKKIAADLIETKISLLKEQLITK